MKFRTPYLFLRPLKLATSNFVHNLGLGLAYQKQRLGPILAGVWARGASKIIWDPLRIFATVEASNFKFGTQLGFGQKVALVWAKGASKQNNNFNCGTQIGFGTSLAKTTFKTKIGGGLGQGNIPKKFGTPYLFLQPLKLTTSNVVCNSGLGLAYQKKRLGSKLAGA